VPEPAPVRVLLDPNDDVRVSVGLLQRHDPAGGLVVAHPTPGMSSPAAIAHDVLGALGRSVRRLAAERLAGLDPAGRAVEAWLLTDEIEDLVVLRADRLSAAGWDWLLQVCRRTGVRLLLVCHVHAVPAALAAVLESVEHQIVTDLHQALPGRGRRAREPASSRTELEPAPKARDLPSYGSEDVARYRRLAPATIGLQGFLGTDEVFQQGQAAAGTWLDTHLEVGATVLDIAKVQLFLVELVQDSPSRNHTLARLRGAQAGFRAHGFDLTLPPWKPMADGRLTGPGLDTTSADLSPAVLERIRSGVAHPAIGAGIAISLLTRMPVLFLHHLPWEALSPDNTVLRLTGFPGYASLFLSTQKKRGKAPLTAVFPVPPGVRPLLQALRHFAELDPDQRPRHRMFASTGFTFERIGPAAAHCAITLPDQRRRVLASLYDTWQGWVTCTHTSWMGLPSDTQFHLDQAFDPRIGRVKRAAMERSRTPQSHWNLRSTSEPVS
jgi:hypothetical protein